MSGIVSVPQRRDVGDRRRNVGSADRVVSALLGTWMLTKRRKNRQGLAKAVAVTWGVMLLRRAATGHSMVYERLGVSSAELDEGAGITIEQAVTILRPLHEVYAFMSDLTNLPAIFTHVATVTVGPGDLSHWSLKAAPGGRSIEWDVRVLNDVADEYISWMSVEGSQVQQSGSVHFLNAGDKGTEVHVKLRYRPPGGAYGFGLAKLLNGITSAQVGADLHRLKQLLETHSVTTVDGQPKGPAVAPKPARAGEEAGWPVSAPREPLQPLKEPEPVVVRGYDLMPGASRQIAGAPVPEVELERTLAGVEGVDALRPVSPFDDDFVEGDEL